MSAIELIYMGSLYPQLLTVCKLYTHNARREPADSVDVR
jgi:hypothetical protein